MRLPRIQFDVLKGPKSKTYVSVTHEDSADSSRRWKLAHTVTEEEVPLVEPEMPEHLFRRRMWAVIVVVLVGTALMLALRSSNY